MPEETAERHETPDYLRCHHHFPEGHRCGSYAIRNEYFCYHHMEKFLPNSGAQARLARRSSIELPKPASRDAIQEAIGKVITSLAFNDLDPRRAGLLLYGLQLATINLNQREKHQPTAELTTDNPQLKLTIRNPQPTTLPTKSPSPPRQASAASPVRSLPRSSTISPHTTASNPRPARLKTANPSPAKPSSPPSRPWMQPIHRVHGSYHVVTTVRGSHLMRTTTLVSLLLLLSVSPLNAAATKKDGSHAAQVDKIFASLTDNHSPGFAVLVRRNNRTVFKRGYGLTDLKTQTPIDAHTDFRLASCTKQFTAMAIMLLVHDHKLRYDEPLTEIFPDFPAYGKSITIRNLLNHTSGLPDYEALMESQPSQWTAEHQIQDSEVLKLLETQDHGKFPPGTKWSYSNSGYVTLGLIVAKASGEPFGDFLHDRIFKPLKMRHTLAFVKGKNEVPHRAYGHSKQDAAFVETDQSSTSATLGDGGVYSNLEDLARWDRALAHHRLLSEAEMQPALTPFKLPGGSLPVWSSDPGDTDPQAGKPVSYGFGWFLDPYKGHPRMWHYGDTTGFKTAIERFTGEKKGDKLTIILLCNRSDVDAAALAAKVADVYLDTAQ